jgi:hypothetical protein
MNGVSSVCSSPAAGCITQYTGDCPVSPAPAPPVPVIRLHVRKLPILFLFLFLFLFIWGMARPERLRVPPAAGKYSHTLIYHWTKLY